jgi:hypothetical protein
MNHSQHFVRTLLVFVLLLASTVVTCADEASGSSEVPGSVLVFPYFTSNLTHNWDTRITFANTDYYRRDGVAGSALTMLYAHVFIIDGQTCSQTDQYVCLTPNATISILASEFDPEVTGYMIIVAVDGATGNPINQNSLIGDAFVSAGSYVGNYSAEAFRAHGDPGLAQDGVLHFGNQTNGYDYVPTRFAFSIQSPVDAPGQRIVTVSLSGDLNSSQLASAGQSSVGYVHNGNEKPFGSFAGFHQGGCQASSIITLYAPRVPTTMARVIPSGQIGTMTLTTRPAVGLFMAPQGNNQWSGIRTLHKTRYSTSSLVIPIFSPVC